MVRKRKIPYWEEIEERGAGIKQIREKQFMISTGVADWTEYKERTTSVRDFRQALEEDFSDVTKPSSLPQPVSTTGAVTTTTTTQKIKIIPGKRRKKLEEPRRTKFVTFSPTAHRFPTVKYLYGRVGRGHSYSSSNKTAVVTTATTTTDIRSGCSAVILGIGMFIIIGLIYGLATAGISSTTAIFTEINLILKFIIGFICIGLVPVIKPANSNGWRVVIPGSILGITLFLFIYYLLNLPLLDFKLF